MQNLRLRKPLLKMVALHFVEFIHYYIGALVCLYFLHYFQSQIPELAKTLGDLASQQKLDNFSLGQFFYLAIAIIFFRTLSRLLFFTPARFQQLNMRVEFIQLLENTHPTRYKDFNDGQIYQIVWNDLNRIRGFLGFGLLQVGNIVIALIVMVPKITAFNPKLLVAFLPLIIGIALFSLLSIFFQPYSRRSMDAQGEVQNFIIESYAGKSTIKNFHSEKSFLERFKDFSVAELKLFFISTIGPTLSIPLIRLAFGASLLWGAYLVKIHSMGASSLIFFSGFLFLILEPLAFLSWIGVVFIAAYSAWKRIREIIDASFEPSLEEKSLSVDNGEGLHFHLPFWEHKVNFDLLEGKWTVFIGETGCGKSFLLKEIADVFKLRDKVISYVDQEPYLYNDTVYNNIFLGKEPDDTEIKLVNDLIKLFGLDVLSDSQKSVLDVEVGEMGKKVSGGQAKRICLLRSIVSGASILIWDDPFSSVDLILEKDIIQKLKVHEIFKDITVVLSSHRLSTVRFSDKIIYLEKKVGILEEGNVATLLNGESKTSEYFKKQTL